MASIDFEGISKETAKDFGFPAVKYVISIVRTNPSLHLADATFEDAVFTGIGYAYEALRRWNAAHGPQERYKDPRHFEGYIKTVIRGKLINDVKKAIRTNRLGEDYATGETIFATFISKDATPRDTVDDASQSSSLADYLLNKQTKGKISCPAENTVLYNDLVDALINIRRSVATQESLISCMIRDIVDDLVAGVDDVVPAESWATKHSIRLNYAQRIRYNAFLRIRKALVDAELAY